MAVSLSKNKRKTFNETKSESYVVQICPNNSRSNSTLCKWCKNEDVACRIYLSRFLDKFFIGCATLLLIIGCLFQNAVGSEWKKLEIKSFAWFRSVYFLDAQRGFIVGSRGAFFETEDGGKSWKQQPKFTSDNLLDVYFADEKTGWLLCEKASFDASEQTPSYLLKTTDGGETWQRLDFVGEKRRFSRFVTKNRNKELLVVGESGALYSVVENELKKINLPTFYRITAGFALSKSLILVGGNGLVLFTDELTAEWRKAEFNNTPVGLFNSVYFIDDQRGWAVGNQGKIYSTLTSGKSWWRQQSGTNTNLNDVFFISANEGFVVGDDGLILQTKTAGISWTQVKSPTSHKLERLFFIGKRGFAVGFGGTVLVYDR